MWLVPSREYRAAVPGDGRLGIENRLKAPVAVARQLDRYRTVPGDHRLAARTVAFAVLPVRLGISRTITITLLSSLRNHQSSRSASSACNCPSSVRSSDMEMGWQQTWQSST